MLVDCFQEKEIQWQSHGTQTVLRPRPQDTPRSSTWAKDTPFASGRCRPVS